MTDAVSIEPRGRFSLAAAARFGFGPTEGGAPDVDGVLRLAFAADGGRGYVGVVLRQPEPDGPVRAEFELRDGASLDASVAQVQRIVSLDHDGLAFERLGDDDPVLGALQRAHPGERPVLFPSPYEAAAWAVISARRPSAQGATVRAALARQLGETFSLAGRETLAFPGPEHLLTLGDQFPGLNLEKLTRLRGVAGAGADGELDVARLHGLGPEAAFADVQRLKGLGPFYAGLVVLRASGFADAPLMAPEPKVLGHAAVYYRLDKPPTLEAFSALAQHWRPFRTWATVLIRMAGERGTEIGGV